MKDPDESIGERSQDLMMGRCLADQERGTSIQKELELKAEKPERAEKPPN